MMAWRHSRRSRLIGIALLTWSATACGSSLAGDETNGSLPSSTPEVGASAGGFTTMELSMYDGSSLRLQNLAGRPVVVNFFASWCAPCVREMPEIEAVKQQLGERVAFVGVNVMDDAERADELVADAGVTWLLVRDPDGAVLQAAGGRAMPTTLVLDADGRVVEGRSGGLDADELLDMLVAVGVTPGG